MKHNIQEDNVLITVLMTVYCGKEFLPEAIESILNQTYRKIEFIIVNEYGSDEDTTAILQRYARQDSRIKLLQNDVKLGFSASLNKGLKLARGKYIARMDPDDISVPKRLELQYKFMEQHPEIMLCGGNIRYIMNNTLTYHTQNYLKKADQIKTSLLFICEFSHPTVMFRRTDMEGNNYLYDENIKTEDYELWSRIVYNHQTANLGKTLLYYRIHNNNSVSVCREKVAESTTEVQKRIFHNHHIDINLKNQVLEGAYNLEQLEELEEALLKLLMNNREDFPDKFVFRNRMDVVYRNSEKNMGIKIDKNRRYWKQFGSIYHNEMKFVQVMDYFIFVLKDILWNCIYSLSAKYRLRELSVESSAK